MDRLERLRERLAFRRAQQAESRAMRPRTGPCLGCGEPTMDLMPGRDAGFHVYCAACLIIPRHPATVEER